MFAKVGLSQLECTFRDSSPIRTYNGFTCPSVSNEAITGTIGLDAISDIVISFLNNRYTEIIQTNVRFVKIYFNFLAYA